MMRGGIWRAYCSAKSASPVLDELADQLAGDVAGVLAVLLDRLGGEERQHELALGFVVRVRRFR